MTTKFDSYLGLLALVEKVARLNPAAGEIGPGMLASLVAEARECIGYNKLNRISAIYEVPAKFGARIIYCPSGRKGKPFYGEIIGAHNDYIRVKFDDGVIGLLHPVWNIEYE